MRSVYLGKWVNAAWHPPLCHSGVFLGSRLIGLKVSVEAAVGWSLLASHRAPRQQWTRTALYLTSVRFFPFNILSVLLFLCPQQCGEEKEAVEASGRTAGQVERPSHGQGGEQADRSGHVQAELPGPQD